MQMADLIFTAGEVQFIQDKFRLNESHLGVFIEAAKRYNLNPIANQIYPQVRQGKLSITTGIDGYRLVADRTGKYAGNDDPVYDNEESPKVATVTVYKIVSGNRCAFTASARWDQYFPGEKQGFMWKKMPHLMLGKCAEALALRKAFPAELSGIYTAEEMEQAGEPAVASPSPKAQREVPPHRDEVETTVGFKKAFVATVADWIGEPDVLPQCKKILEKLGIAQDGSANAVDFGNASAWVSGQMDASRTYDEAMLGKEVEQEEDKVATEPEGEEVPW
jgi:phage recombination protein Bet